MVLRWNALKTDVGALVEQVVADLAFHHLDRSITIEAAGGDDDILQPQRLGQLASNLVGSALTHDSTDEPVPDLQQRGERDTRDLRRQWRRRDHGRRTNEALPPLYELTMNAREDVARYHHRQIIPLTRDQWADWLDPDVPAKDVLKYLPKGSLPVTRVYPPPSAPTDEPALAL